MSSLRDQLQSVYDAYGKLTPALVLQEATNPTHPLHNRFEWDDSVAAAKYRLDQAHELIRTVRVVYRDSSETDRGRDVRAFHAVRSDTGYVYEPAEVVAADPLLSKIVLADMAREWKAMHRRYAEFDEFRIMVQRDMGGGDAQAS